MLSLSSLLSRKVSATLCRCRCVAAPSSLSIRTVIARDKASQRNSSRAVSSSSSLSPGFDGGSVSPEEPTMNVAFVGLGNMGLQMALNLARPRSGVDNDDTLPSLHLTVYDLHQSNITSFFNHAEKIEEIANSRSTLSAASDLLSLGISNPDFLITSLPTCAASEVVVGNVLKSLPTCSTKGGGCTFVDTSTISPSISKKLHQMVTSLSPHEYVDAPVSGGVKGAKDASLTFMVGCSSETFSSIQPLLHRMGKRIIPCGGPGSGSAVKLCNNAALAAQMVGICEAMNLGNALGVDPSVLAGVMNVSTAKCWSSEVNNPHPDAARFLGSGASVNGYEGGFATELMLKDLNLAVDAGEEEGLALPVSGMTRDLYKLASLHGYGNKDFGIMFDFLRGSNKNR